jgi:hypothetical protein
MRVVAKRKERGELKVRRKEDLVAAIHGVFGRQLVSILAFYHACPFSWQYTPCHWVGDVLGGAEGCAAHRTVLVLCIPKMFANPGLGCWKYQAELLEIPSV